MFFFYKPGFYSFNVSKDPCCATFGGVPGFLFMLRATPFSSALFVQGNLDANFVVGHRLRIQFQCLLLFGSSDRGNDVIFLWKRVQEMNASASDNFISL